MMENLGRGWAVPAPWRKPCDLPGRGGTYLGNFDNCEAWTFKKEYKCITGVLTVGSATRQRAQFNEELFLLLFYKGLCLH